MTIIEKREKIIQLVIYLFTQDKKGVLICLEEEVSCERNRERKKERGVMIITTQHYKREIEL